MLHTEPVSSSANPFFVFLKVSSFSSMRGSKTVTEPICFDLEMLFSFSGTACFVVSVFQLSSTFLGLFRAFIKNGVNRRRIQVNDFIVIVVVLNFSLVFKRPGVSIFFSRKAAKSQSILFFPADFANFRRSFV